MEADESKPRFEVNVWNPRGVRESRLRTNDVDEAMRAFVEITKDFGNRNERGSYSALIDNEQLYGGAFVSEGNGTYSYKFDKPEGHVTYEQTAQSMLAEREGHQLPTVNGIEPQLELEKIDDQVRAWVKCREAQSRSSLSTAEEPGVAPEFVSSLDQRMKQAELADKGWQGREDIQPVMKDLERLASTDYAKALALWEKHLPDEMDLPAELERAQWPNDPAPFSRNEERDNEDKVKVFDPPAGLAKRYLQAENRYYFREDNSTLAFEDKGSRLATDRNDPDVARSMVELAQAKGWAKLHLKGTAEFRRDAWLEANLRGLQTKGYEPRDVDVARLAELQQEKNAQRDSDARTQSQNSITREAFPEKLSAQTHEHINVDDSERRLSPQQTTAVEALRTILRERGDSDKEIAAAVNLATERFQNNRVYVGKLVEHGDAPYEFKRENKHSHFVRLETPQGEKVVWGVDLKRALQEGEVKQGEQVAIAYQGHRKVTVSVNEKDADGRVIGQRPVTTNRNEWAAEKVEKIRTDAMRVLEAAANRTVKQPVVRTFDRNAPRPTPSHKPNPPRNHDRSR